VLEAWFACADDKSPAAATLTDTQLAEWISAWEYGATESQDPLPFALSLPGTPFQQQVWQAIQGIARGQVITYAALAALIGRPSAVRAVAAACGANRLALFVPCHRVVASDGGLAGFRWGIERKQALLALEGLPSSQDASGRWRVSLPVPAAGR
jgi:AraC family transcriptional regulator of adaptative response/methylated-DNA-[protein]-cysteine methyltransferase